MRTTSMQTVGNAGKQVKQPERLSAIGQWWKENPGGIIKVIDRRAVNK
jgi:hypothetical protein